MIDFNWKQQTIVLTGASGGLGRAMATALSQRGATVILVGRDVAVIEALAEQLDQEFIIADLTQTQQRTELLQKLESRGTRMTGLINNAAVTHEGLFEDATIADLEKVIATNVTAPLALTHQLLPLLARHSGWVLNVGSVLGAIGFPGQALYCASKFALRGFSEALQRELASNIDVMYAAPRAINTDLNHGLIRRLNTRLKAPQDDPKQVADQLLRQIERRRPLQTLGWPERLFVRVNGFWPEQVGRSLKKTRNTLYQLIEEEHHETY